jgi:hypothetical protein
VGLLLPYPLEAKERCIDLLDMRLGPPALNVGVISASVACLLPLCTHGPPLRCPLWVVMLSIRYLLYFMVVRSGHSFN